MSKAVVDLLDSDPWNRAWAHIETTSKTGMRGLVLNRLRGRIGDRIESFIVLPLEDIIISDMPRPLFRDV